MTDNEDDREVSMHVIVACLDSSNDFTCSCVFEIYLRGMGLWHYVKEDAPTSGSFKALDNVLVQKQDMALTYNVMSSRLSCKAAFMTCGKPGEVWCKLKNL